MSLDTCQERGKIGVSRHEAFFISRQNRHCSAKCLGLDNRESRTVAVLVQGGCKMSDRKSIGKKIRFEVFKRDKFTCQYCGKQPPDVVLVIDHIHPVKDGGGNDTLNLLTACVECNQGKGANKLTTLPNRPDADLEWLEMQQEIVELRRYQLSKVHRDELTLQIIHSFQNDWWRLVDEETAPSDSVFVTTMTWASPEQIEQAIKILANKSRTLRTFDDRMRYFMGILHNLATEE